MKKWEVVLGPVYPVGDELRVTVAPVYADTAYSALLRAIEMLDSRDIEWQGWRVTEVVTV